jgi:hypothetical protein
MHIFGKPCMSGIRMSWYKIAPENEKKAYRVLPWVILVPLWSLLVRISCQMN